MQEALPPGQCARIFTGAAVPPGTHRVLMQEHCERDGTTVKALWPEQPASNIRRAGEQFRTGELLLPSGTIMDPAGIGLLASAGVDEVEVSFKPYVAIVRTGDEFIEPGVDRAGRIFSSNDRMLHAALHAEQCEVDERIAFLAGDDDNAIELALRDALEADAVITTGGVSVGDHDRVEAVLKSMGATIHFHGVAQKPGKPMLFATLENKPVFALPGNPRAVMVLFWEYVLPFIRKMQGATSPWPRTDAVPVGGSLSVKGDRAEFRAVRIRNGKAEMLPDEGSHMLRTLCIADALAYLPAEKRTWVVDEPIEVHYLPR
jgi:molybdopterin molybdotransferase